MCQSKWGGGEGNTTLGKRSHQSNISLAQCFALHLPRVRREGKNTHLTAGNAAAEGSARGPRIFASNSAVGQESAGRPYLTCIAFTALRLACPSTPSTLPTLNPARTRSCCNSLISLNGSCATGWVGWRIGGAPA